MTEPEHKTNKTPEYTLRAIKAYTARNPELTKQRNHEKYLKLTPEQKETYKLRRQYSRSNMTQEQRDAYNAKQRAYYQKKKNTNTSVEQNNIVDIPIDNLKITN